jgi:hypothetical protein
MQKQWVCQALVCVFRGSFHGRALSQRKPSLEKEKHMRATTLYGSKRPVISMEFFPPRDEKGI